MTGLLRNLEARDVNAEELQKPSKLRDENAVNKRPAIVVADELGK
ncbi:hypothetical protein Ptr902_04178 [Pyrenophora tritici-repentis]|nr:hypothetical protein Ptr902_04178 [Pyrenophora tritici-repentis]